MSERNVKSDSEFGSDFNLEKEFRFCDGIVSKLEQESGGAPTFSEELSQCIERLEVLIHEVTARALFSENETIDDIPANYIKYLLLPSFMATLTQNINNPTETRVDILNKAKRYFRSFLEMLHFYKVIDFTLPWIDEDVDMEERQVKSNDIFELRNKKRRMYEQQRQLEQSLKILQTQYDRGEEDDSLLRKLYLTRVRLSALKALSELQMIEQELPLAERMLKIRSGELKADPLVKPPQSRPPFIITRDQIQKKVFGLGYPSVPKMTVNEWYDEMANTGGFANSSSASVVPENKSDDSDDEQVQEEKREKAIKWDEYKDFHRRGWGNMHNKG